MWNYLDNCKHHSVFNCNYWNCKILNVFEVFVNVEWKSSLLLIADTPYSWFYVVTPPPKRDGTYFINTNGFPRLGHGFHYHFHLKEVGKSYHPYHGCSPWESRIHKYEFTCKRLGIQDTKNKVSWIGSIGSYSNLHFWKVGNLSFHTNGFLHEFESASITRNSKNWIVEGLRG